MNGAKISVFEFRENFIKSSKKNPKFKVANKDQKRNKCKNGKSSFLIEVKKKFFCMHRMHLKYYV